MSKINIENCEVSLFATCIVDQLFPDVAESTSELLTKLGIKVNFPLNQSCCGQMAFNIGYTKEAEKVAREFINTFHDSQYIVAPSGSCTSMIKHHYKTLFKNDANMIKDLELIENQIFELTEFIVDVLNINDFSSLKNYIPYGEPKTVTYHKSCHQIRELGAITQATDLLESLTNIDLIEMNQSDVCCGFGGMFSMKFPEISNSILEDKIENIIKTGADTIVACDNSCLMHIGGKLSRNKIQVNVSHISELLNKYLI